MVRTSTFGSPSQVGSSDLGEGRPWFDAADRRSGCGEISRELAGAAPNLQDPAGVGNPRELDEVVDRLGWVTRSRPIIERGDAIEDPSLSCAALGERAGQRDAGGNPVSPVGGCSVTDATIEAASPFARHPHAVAGLIEDEAGKSRLIAARDAPG